jgi:DNA-binding LacI/PurR family transcriptional regulator
VTSAGPRALRRPSIYEVAKTAGVAASAVSRAVSKPGRVNLRTAEHVQKVAAELGYRSEVDQRNIPAGRTARLSMVVADITNPASFGMIRGAERTVKHPGYTLLLVETQESEETECLLLERIMPAVDGVIPDFTTSDLNASRDNSWQADAYIFARMEAS